MICIHLSLPTFLSISHFPSPVSPFNKAEKIRGEKAPEKVPPIKNCSTFPAGDAADISPLFLFPKTMNKSTISRNGNSTTQACAACKYQRRKCAPDCLLAPYFPHDRQRQFLNAHKLFGVSNISKIIRYLDPHLKDQAMRTIIYQSDMRASDPVGGCYRYIQELQAQIEYHRAELELVLQQLAIFRAQAAHVFTSASTNANVTVNGDEVMNTDPLSLYNPAAVVASTPHYHYLQPQVPQQDQYIMVQGNNDNSSDNNTSPLQDQHVNSWTMQNSMSMLSLQGQNSNGSVVDEYDHKAMVDIPSDDRNELRFEPEELVHRSDEAFLFKIDDAVIKAEADCIQQAQDHDLKGRCIRITT